MTPDEFYTMVGHRDVLKDVDIKTLVLDLTREKLSEAELMEIFWRHLPDLHEEYIRGYFYRKFGSQ